MRLDGTRTTCRSLVSRISGNSQMELVPKALTVPHTRLCTTRPRCTCPPPTGRQQIGCSLQDNLEAAPFLVSAMAQQHNVGINQAFRHGSVDKWRKRAHRTEVVYCVGVAGTASSADDVEPPGKDTVSPRTLVPQRHRRDFHFPNSLWSSTETPRRWLSPTNLRSFPPTHE